MITTDPIADIVTAIVIVGALLGSGVMGYCLGYMDGRRKQRVHLIDPMMMPTITDRRISDSELTRHDRNDGAKKQRGTQ